jgi:hypothetical protein
MINLDLTKVFHPKVADLLAAFEPGLFFVVSVLLANPQYAQRIVGVMGAMGAELYIQLFVLLFLAFVLGSALILWVRFIQILLSNLYARLHDWKRKIFDWRIRRAVSKTQSAQAGQPDQAPQAPSKTWLKLQAAQSKQVQHEESVTSAQMAWETAATQLLKRYGIEVAHPDLTPWVRILGAEEIRPQDLRGFLFVMALHATGWSGLLALYFAPVLRTWSYTIFSLFLVGYGLLHDREVARDNSNEVWQWLIRLRCVLAELEKTRVSDGVQKADSAKQDGS